MTTALFKCFRMQHFLAAILWCTIALHVSAAPSFPDSLLAGEYLLGGESIQSLNGEVELVMQHDGNLVLYRVRDFTPLWHTYSWGHSPAAVAMQEDGNLVVSGPNGSVLFSSDTRIPGTRLVLQSDNNLVLYAPDGSALWSSNTWVQTPADSEELDTDRLPLDSGPEVPSADQKACKDDEQFFQVGVDGDSSNALLNRHVLCVRQRFSHSVDVRDPTGFLHTNAGTMTVDAKWSVHGVHNKLQKKGTLTLRYGYTKHSDLAVPTLKVVAQISCRPLDSVRLPNCDKLMPMFALTAGGESSEDVDILLDWGDDPKITTNVIEVQLWYTTDGTIPVPNGSASTYSLDPNFGAWAIRCDFNELRKGWKGCVFPDAAAVWVPEKNPSTQYARQHIADVFANSPDIPGRFKLAYGKRSVAETGGQYEPLTRSSPEVNKLNRSASQARCAIPAPAPYCAADMRCDCDEYPPASADEGAYLRADDRYSVRKILSSDNRKAGAQMGAMFSKERVLVGDKFRIFVD